MRVTCAMLHIPGVFTVTVRRSISNRPEVYDSSNWDNHHTEKEPLRTCADHSFTLDIRGRTTKWRICTTSKVILQPRTVL
mmetsp:Transcript_39997/g.46610  ORF Transcript_39997/g.46610 Transcript_39997/m.46610 type:complete len:80 (-) Transcript_39997:61-300(-)